MARFAFLLMFCVFAAARADENSDVIELDEDGFLVEIVDMDIVLIEFYAPW